MSTIEAMTEDQRQEEAEYNRDPTAYWHARGRNTTPGPLPGHTPISPLMFNVGRLQSLVGMLERAKTKAAQRGLDTSGHDREIEKQKRQIAVTREKLANE